MGGSLWGTCPCRSYIRERIKFLELSSCARGAFRDASHRFGNARFCGRCFARAPIARRSVTAGRSKEAPRSAPRRKDRHRRKFRKDKHARDIENGAFGAEKSGRAER